MMWLVNICEASQYCRVWPEYRLSFSLNNELLMWDRGHLTRAQSGVCSMCASDVCFLCKNLNFDMFLIKCTVQEHKEWTVLHNVTYYNLMIMEVSRHSVAASITPNQSSVENVCMYSGATWRISGGTTVDLMLFGLLNYKWLGEKMERLVSCIQNMNMNCDTTCPSW